MTLRVRFRSAFLATVLVGVAGCSDVVKCSCGPGDRLYFELKKVVPEGGTVEICFERSCGTGRIESGDGTANGGKVLYASLGRWSEDKTRQVAVRVRDRNGAILVEERDVPEKRASCCGDYWTAHA